MLVSGWRRTLCFECAQGRLTDTADFCKGPGQEHVANRLVGCQHVAQLLPAAAASKYHCIRLLVGLAHLASPACFDEPAPLLLEEPLFLPAGAGTVPLTAAATLPLTTVALTRTAADDARPVLCPGTFCAALVAPGPLAMLSPALLTTGVFAFIASKRFDVSFSL